MNLEFKPISAKDIDRLTPFYMMRRNKTCDSVFLESFLWREYYNVRVCHMGGQSPSLADGI